MATIMHHSPSSQVAHQINGCIPLSFINKCLNVIVRMLSKRMLIPIQGEWKGRKYEVCICAYCRPAVDDHLYSSWPINQSGRIPGV